MIRTTHIEHINIVSDHINTIVFVVGADGTNGSSVITNYYTIPGKCIGKIPATIIPAKGKLVDGCKRPSDTLVLMVTKCGIHVASLTSTAYHVLFSLDYHISMNYSGRGNSLDNVPSKAILSDSGSHVIVSEDVYIHIYDLRYILATGNIRPKYEMNIISSILDKSWEGKPVVRIYPHNRIFPNDLGVILGKFVNYTTVSQTAFDRRQEFNNIILSRQLIIFCAHSGEENIVFIFKCTGDAITLLGEHRIRDIVYKIADPHPMATGLYINHIRNHSAYMSHGKNYSCFITGTGGFNIMSICTPVVRPGPDMRKVCQYYDIKIE